MEYEEKVCEFKKYAKQTLDLMVAPTFCIRQGFL